MIITNCPSFVQNGNGCASHRINSCECEKVDACVLKQMVIICQTAKTVSDGLISADVLLGYLNVT